MSGCWWVSDLAMPIVGAARHMDNRFGGEVARQEPDELPVTALDGS
jgi:hypothetical protein